MPRILLNRWPEGRRHALSFSYDDGRDHDRRLVEIFNRHGLKGTFNLNSGKLDTPGHLTAAECPDLFAGQEVAIHSVTHPDLTALSVEGMRREILDDRRRLEDVMGQVITGMAYPFGCYNQRVIDELRTLGVSYARTVETAPTPPRPWGWFGLPKKWLAWHPSCHDRNAPLEGFRNCLSQPQWRGLSAYCVWGHSYEFEDQGRWESFEDFCKAAVAEASGQAWFATNAEICQYARDLRRLEFSLGETRVHNPTARTLWIEAEGEVVAVEPGLTRSLA